MATVKMTDVAAAANVSIATVGRVLHNNGYVSEDARKRVEEAINRLGYVPNRMARALKQKRSNIIGSLVTYNRNDLYQKINNSVITEAEKHGYKILTMEVRAAKNDEADLIDQLIGMQVDAIVLTSNPNIERGIFDKLQCLGTPVVAVERTYEHPFVDNLEVRDTEGSYNAVKNMIDHGHRNIGIIGALPHAQVELRRLTGYKTALKDNGIEVKESLIQLSRSYSLEEGYQGMVKLLESGIFPTAVFCTADTLAAGAMQYLYEKKLHVPTDISIVGYDNVHASYVSPPIDSVDLSTEHIGKKVIAMIENRLENIEIPPQREYLDTIYVSRGTVTRR